MNSLYQDVLAITKAAVNGCDYKVSEDADWGKIFSVLRRNKLVPITYDAVNKKAEELKVPSDIIAAWKQNCLNISFRQMFTYSELKKIIAAAEASDLKLVMFKGIGLAKLYPNCNLRGSSDSDILVAVENRQKAVELLEAQGFSSTEDGAKDHVPVFVKSVGPMTTKIELHDCLWEDYEGKQADMLESFGLAADSKLIKDTFQGIEFYSLGISEHLVYQIFHIVKHLFFEGIALRYFTDISLFIDNYNDEINWPEVRRMVSALHYEKFLDCILAICKEHLGMKADVEIGEVTEEMKDYLIEDVLGEKQQHSESETWDTINFLNSYFMRESAVKGSKFSQRRKQILPLPSELNDKFAYARKYPILLPIAWVHRWCFFASFTLQGRKEGKDRSAVMKKSQQRLDLMRELDLMDTDK